MPTMSSMPVSKSQTVSVKVKYIWVIVVVFLVLLATAPIVYYVSSSNAPQSSGGAAPSAPAGTQPNCGNPCTISIQNSQFGTNPSGIVVKAGTTVVWVNNDGTQHTVTSDTGLFGSKILNPGKSFQFTFASAGTFTYHCQIHPMTGAITVVS